MYMLKHTKVLTLSHIHAAVKNKLCVTFNQSMTQQSLSAVISHTMVQSRCTFDTLSYFLHVFNACNDMLNVCGIAITYIASLTKAARDV